MTRLAHALKPYAVAVYAVWSVVAMILALPVFWMLLTTGPVHMRVGAGIGLFVAVVTMVVPVWLVRRKNNG